jgi:CRISPR-associated endoribonuclease Cas6
MPAKLTLHLELLENALVRPTQAPNQGWFLALAHNLDPTWAHELHSDNQLDATGRKVAQITRPYALAPFRTADALLLEAPDTSNRTDGATIPRGTRLTLTVGLADGGRGVQLASALDQGNLALPPLGGGRVRLYQPLLSDNTNKVESWEEIVRGAGTAKEVGGTLGQHRATLHCLSPLVQEKLGKPHLLPDLENLWEGWARAWAMFSEGYPLPAPASTPGVVPNVIGYQLNTAPIALKGGTVTGYHGAIGLEWAYNTAPEAVATGRALLRLGTFLGAGRKTTMGLGHIALESA